MRRCNVGEEKRRVGETSGRRNGGEEKRRVGETAGEVDWGGEWKAGIRKGFGELERCAPAHAHHKECRFSSKE